MPFKAAVVELQEDIKEIMTKFARSRTLQARQVQHAKIILLAADGLDNMKISKQVGLGQDWGRIVSANGGAILLKNFRIFKR